MTEKKKCSYLPLLSLTQDIKYTGTETYEEENLFCPYTGTCIILTVLFSCTAMFIFATVMTAAGFSLCMVMMTAGRIWIKV